MSATVSSRTLLTHQAFLSERVPFTLMYLVLKFFHESTSAAPSSVMLNLEISVNCSSKMVSQSNVQQSDTWPSPELGRSWHLCPGHWHSSQHGPWEDVCYLIRSNVNPQERAVIHILTDHSVVFGR